MRTDQEREHARVLARARYARIQAGKPARREAFLADWSKACKNGEAAIAVMDRLDAEQNQGVSSVRRKRSEVP